LPASANSTAAALTASQSARSGSTIVGSTQAFDIGPRSITRAAPGALVLVERAFKQGSKNRWLDRRPIRFCGVDQQLQLIRIERNRFGVFERGLAAAR
jgi:hypothetical protein